MKKSLWLGVLAGFSLFFPSESQAWPTMIPYQIAVDTWNVASVQLSTTNFPSASSTINANVASDQWCVSHLVVSSSNVPTFVTIAWSTSPLNAQTTDFLVLTHGGGIPYDTQWGVQSPYCAPTGKTNLFVNSSVNTSTISLEGFLWKGLSP